MGDELRRSGSRWRRGTSATLAITLTIFAARGAEARSKKTTSEKTSDKSSDSWKDDGKDEESATSAPAKGSDDAKSETKDIKRDTKADEQTDTSEKGEKADDAPPPPPAPPPPSSHAPAPLASGEPGWQMGFYGWLELDAMWDSTQSFNETVLDQTIARPYTYAGDNPRLQATPKDSRIGFKVAAPAYGSIKTSGQFEADFFGIQPTTASQDQTYTYASIRLRHYYAKLETPVLDLLVGQTFDLYGWGGQGFFPSTPAFLGVMGEVFHRNVQLRLSKTIGPLEIAVAGVRPATRDSGVPDVQAGLKLQIKGLQGASAQGPRPAKAAPLAFGVSGVGRRMSVTDFQAITADAQTVYGWGAAVDAFIPIIPVHGDDLSNGLSVTGEYSRGTGVTDLYLTLNGGVLFPSLPNPKNVLPAPVYTANIDPGIVTFDADGIAHSINWQGWMVNVHYNFPFNKGKTLSLAGTYSEVRSSNALALTPEQGQFFVWNKGQYFDGTLWWSITPAFQMCLSFQTETQTFGGDGMIARNNRGEAAWWFFF
jgi:hypothetical protein